MFITSSEFSLLPFVLAVSIFSGISKAGFAQDKEAEGSPPTNVEIVRMLSEKIGAVAGRMLAGPDSTTVKLSVYPRELAWYIDGGLTKGLSQQGCQVVASETARHSAEFGLIDIDIEYSNIGSHGLLGPRVVNRRITETLSAKLIDQRSGVVISSRDMREEASDSIELSQIDRVESPYLPLLRGALPPEGFFSNFAEPLILLGSVAVAIFLLFKVRS